MADHDRAHLMLDTDDHSDVETYLNQALLTTSSPTFDQLTLTTKATTPLVDSSGNLRLLPTSGSALLIGASGSTMREVVIGSDPDSLAGTADRVLSIRNLYSSAVTGTGRMVLVTAQCGFADDTKSLYGAEYQAVFGGSSHCKGVGLAGSGIFVGAMTGTVPEGVGLRGFFGVSSGNPSATITDFSAIQGTLHSLTSSTSIGTFSYLHAKNYLSSPSGSITTAIALNLEVPTIGTTNYLAKFGGAGNLLCVGTPTFLANAAGVTPLAVKLAASQTSDAWQVQDSSGSVLARFNESGFLGIGVDPTNMFEIARETAACNIVAARYGDAYPGQIALKQARGTIASPSATQSGDYIGSYYFQGYGTTAFKAGAFISAVAAQNFTDSAVGTSLKFVRCKTGSASTSLALTLSANGNIIIPDASNVELDTSTGTKWGSTTSQKQAWWNATPVVQQSHIADASTGHGVTDWATTNTALDNLGSKINELISLVETLGFTATS